MIRIFIFCFCVINITLQAQLDNTFNGQGYRRIASNAYPTAIMSDQNRKTTVAGIKELNSDMANIDIVRCTEQGHLDSTFNADGKMNVEVNPYLYSIPVGLFPLPDDRFLVLVHNDDYVGWSDGQISVLKLLPDGSYDLNFMGTGFRLSIMTNMFVEQHVVFLQDDQKLVIGGYAGEFIYGMTEFAISRIDTLGFLDLSFGTNGYVITNLGVTGTFYASILDIILQSDGKIVALGDLFESPRRSLVLLRYLSNGQPDSTFGVNGVTKLGMDSTYFSAVNILQQADGKFLVHTVKSPGNDVYLLRFNLDGSLDTTYQNAGLAPLDINNYYFDMTMLSDGKLVFVGNTPQDQMSVAKLNPNGTLDSLFGQNGISELNLPEEVPAGALAVQDDGKIVVCGRAVDSLYNSKIVIARFLNNLSLGLLNFSKEGSEYYVYPNPIVDHAFTVQFNLAEDEVMSVRLMDSQGKWIQNYFDHENKLKGDHTLNLIWPDYLPSGHYFITFETSQGYSTLQLLKP